MVCTTEMIHILDGKNFATSTSDTINKLTAHLTDPMLRFNPSSEAMVDQSAQFKALAVLAPNGAVEALRPSYEEGRRTNLEIAKILMIPQYYIPLLFDPEFIALRPYL